MKNDIIKPNSKDIWRMNAITMNGGSDMNSLGISTRAKIRDGMEVWLYRFKQNGVKKATFERLLTSFELLKRYSISEKCIGSLTTTDVQDFINELRDDGYAYNTIKKAYNLVSAFLKFLLGDGVQIKPSYLNVVLPSPENTIGNKEEVVTYSKPEQMRIIAAANKDNSLGSKAAIIMLETGIRSGEALALSWRDVEWDRKAIYIHKTLVYPASTKRCFVQNSPKSKGSVRHLPLSSRAFSLLEALYEESIPQSEDELIFYRQGDRNSSMGYNLMSSQIEKLCNEANVEYKGLHVFRHTFATNCYYKGCEIKKLSKFLGHSSVTVTYNTYIHLFGDALDELRSIVV